MNAPIATEVLLEKNGTVPFNIADFYKTGHPHLFPEGMTNLVSNWTPRSAKHAPVLKPLFDNKVVWFGLTGFLQEFLVDMFNRDFFGAANKERAIRKYKRRMDTALGKGVVSTDKVAALWELGYLPLEVRALPEGARVNIKVPPAIFLPTHRDFAWVGAYIETLFSCEMWKPSTVATIAFEFRKLFLYFAKLTGAPEEFVDWQGHDFSMRGMSGVHDAMRCGSAHLLSFCGTDTIPAIDYLEDHYGANAEEEIIGGSIPATEHSIMTLRILLWMKRLAGAQFDLLFACRSMTVLTAAEVAAHIERLKLELSAVKVDDEKALRKLAEKEVFRELITIDFPTGMVSIVSDSFDYWATVTEIVPSLKQEILNRKPNELGMCKVVLRPDSGDPVKILTGYFDDELVCDSNGQPMLYDDGNYRSRENEKAVTAAERKGSVQCLWDTFGGTETAKGFKVLDSHIGLIYGDSINLQRALAIFTRLMKKGFASCNVVMGIGSFTYNYLSRDTFGWAMKGIFAEVLGVDIEIYKDPATDDGTKRSAKGLPRVEKVGNDYVLYDQQTKEQFELGAYRPAFRNGNILVHPTLKGMRQELRDSWTCPDHIDWAEAA